MREALLPQTILRINGVALGHAIALLVEALCYKPEGRGFDSQCHWIFQLT
jgi:hypothetical protein